MPPLLSRQCRKLSGWQVLWILAYSVHIASHILHPVPELEPLRDQWLRMGNSIIGSFSLFELQAGRKNNILLGFPANILLWLGTRLTFPH